ncbi:MAG: hypothetical protein M1431_01520 [Candidatus Thermoplasmatota archaeon]|nr:hypothetical protein [Candidatus Thermoplasmatota archaeon]
MDSIDYAVPTVNAHLDLTGGELLMAILRLHKALCKKQLDLTRLNMLAFMAEGECGISSDITFTTTKFGPKSAFIGDFIHHNREIFHVRKTGGAITKFPDPDLRIKISLTEAGDHFSSRVINFLTVGKLRSLSHVISKWGDEAARELLTYICVFHDGFCPESIIDQH